MKKPRGRATNNLTRKITKTLATWRKRFEIILSTKKLGLYLSFRLPWAFRNINKSAMLPIK